MADGVRLTSSYARAYIYNVWQAPGQHAAQQGEEGVAREVRHILPVRVFPEKIKNVRDKNGVIWVKLKELFTFARLNFLKEYYDV